MSLNVVGTVTKLATRGLLVAKKFAPEILTAAGIVGGVAASVMGAKATLKLKGTTEETGLDIHAVKTHRDKTSIEEYSTPNYQRDLAIVYTNHVKGVVRLYAVPVALGAASIAAILCAHGILRSRNAALIAAYNALNIVYEKYRGRVRSEYGEEVDTRFVREVETEIFENSPANVKSLKKIDGKYETRVWEGNSRYFDQFNAHYRNNADTNLFFLKIQQTALNDQLKARGHLFLNEVYDALGFERTREGSLLGWLYGSDNMGYVDFGLSGPHAADFIEGKQPGVLLTFNVDGLIHDKI